MMIRLTRGNHTKVHEITNPTSFLLMRYANRSTKRVEWIWNSRDGVAPQMIHDPSYDLGVLTDWTVKAEEASRAGQLQDFKNLNPDPSLLIYEAGQDVFIPNFVPPVGMRVFISYGDAPQSVREDVARNWEQKIKTAADPEIRAAMRRMTTPFELEPSDPIEVVVDRKIHDLFMEDAANRPWSPAPPPSIIGVTTPGLVGRA